MKNKNEKKLKSFTKYCEQHPDERFWQALLNWSKLPYILCSDSPPPGSNVKDTFFWEGKNG